MQHVFLRAAPLLAALASSSCWYAGHANGSTGNLYFWDIAGTAGTKLAFPLEVTRYPDQWQSICTTPASFGAGRTDRALRPQGGDPCLGGSSPLQNTPIALVEASCDDAACTVEDGAAKAATSGDLRLLVTPLRAGNLTVHVTARATDGSGSWDDSYTFSVVDVAKVSFVHPPYDDASTAFGVFVGAPVSWTPRAYDETGSQLVAADEAFAVNWDDGAVGQSADGSMRALKVGRGTVSLQAGGLTQTDSVQVVDPGNAAAVEVRRSGSDWTDLVDVGTDLSVPGALSEIVLESSQEGPFVLVATLPDGTRAMGGAQSLRVAGGGDVSASPETNASYGWAFWINDEELGPPAAWSLTGGVGGAQLTVPIRRSWESVDGGGVGEDAGGDGGDGSG